MNIFTTREIATGFWLLVFAIWALSNRAVRQSLWGVAGSLFHPKIAIPLLILVLYVATIIGGLAQIGFWEPWLLKDTVLWFFFSGVAMAFSGVTSRAGDRPFCHLLKEQLSLLLILEFLVNAYTFHLAIEIFLVPSIVLLELTVVAAESERRYAQVAKLATSLRGTIGLIILALVLARLIAEIDTTAWLRTLREIALPPVLTLSILPLGFLFMIFAKYESLFIRIGLLSDVPTDIKRRAKWRLLRKLGLSPRRIDDFAQSHGAKLSRIQTRSDVDEIVPPT